MNIEPLENRIAPAGFSFNYTDVDGDLVTVKISKGAAADLSPAYATVGLGKQLQALNFNGNQGFKGASITITAKPQDANGDGFLDGDGLVNVGLINATGIDLGKVKVAGDLGQIVAGDATTETTGLASLDVVSLGRFETTTGAPGTGGTIQGRLGTLKVHGDLEGFLVADALGSAAIGGSIDGGFFVNGAAGSVKAGGNLRGAILVDTIASVTIGGSLLGSSADSARISAQGAGGLGMVKIGGDLLAESIDSATIHSNTTIRGLTIGGSVIGTNPGSAAITAGGDVGPVKIGGDLRGDSQTTGYISTSGKLASVTIGGSVSGIAMNSGTIRSTGDLGPVSIGGDLTGGAGMNSGSVVSGGILKSVSIGRDLLGGQGAESGRIFSTGAIGSVSIAGSVVGGNGNGAGSIMSSGAIDALKIGLDLRGGSRVNGDTGDLERTGYIEGTHLGKITIGGSILGGFDFLANATLTKSASIRALDDIASLTVGRDITGRFGNGDEVDIIISARGQAGLSDTATKDVAIGKITVGGSVFRTNILAGYDATTQAGTNADAQIGSVTVGGDWIASNLIAGVQAGGDGFGNANDSKITGVGVKDHDDASGAISKIASVVIKGSAIDTLASNDTAVFGIEAQQIIAIKVGGAKEALQAGASNDLFNLRDPLGATFASDGTGDFRAFEVA